MPVGGDDVGGGAGARSEGGLEENDFSALGLTVNVTVGLSEAA